MCGGKACVAGGMHGRRHAWQGSMHGGGHVWWGCAWQEVCMAGGHVCRGVCGGGVCMAGGACMAGGGGIHGVGVWQERRPLQQTVRILLEYILVYVVFLWPSCSVFY